MPGDDLAPWEQGSGVRKPAAAAGKPHEPEYKLPPDDKLPEVLKPETGAMVAAGDVTLPRPPMATPRDLVPRARLAFGVLGAAGFVGAVLAVLPYLVLSPDLGVVRTIIATLGGLVAIVAFGVAALEWSRLGQYRTLNFFPAVLCFGTAKHFEKYAGPAGLAGINSTRIRGGGRGLLSAVFDRSAKMAAPPEVVALLVDRGAGPELVGVEWDAVRSCQRGDLVWYHARTPNHFVFFHLMVPFAPALATDRATREEAFRALRVGKSMFKDFPKREAAPGAMPKQTKVFKTDASGNIVGAQDGSGTNREFVEGGDSEVELKLSALGGFSGSTPADRSDEQGAHDPLDSATEYSPPPNKVGKYRIGDANKPFGSYGDQDQSGEN